VTDFFSGVRNRPQKEQIKLLAAWLERSVLTIERWRTGGMDIYDADSVVQFWRWNDSRRCNRKPNKIRRRFRSPIE
jgi:hypothetical protein